MTPPSSPLLRVPWSRVLIAVGLVGGHLTVLALATWLLRWLFAPAAFAAMIAFLMAAIAAAAFAAVLVAVPISGRRGLVKMTATVVMAAAAGGVGGAVAAGASSDPCEAFEFERSRWRAALAGPDAVGKTSDAERIARAIDRCRSIDGASRTKVRRLLGGSQSSKSRTWSWPLGTTNDTLGPGDRQDLLVSFDRSGRAPYVSLRSP